MKMHYLALAVFALTPLAVGCGGTDVGDDSFIADDMAMQVYKVQSGTYSVSKLTKVSDACMKNLDDPQNPFSSLAVTNDGHGKLSLGSTNVSYLSDPTLYSQGTGMFSDSYHVTTSLDADADATGCMFHLARMNDVTVTADNTLDVNFTETQTNHSGTCTTGVTTDCTSNWTFTLSMAVH